MPDDTVGAMPAPPDVTPNFENPESIAYRVIVASVLGPVITIPICLLRLYTKRCILRLVSYDDHAIILATIFALGFSILTGYQTTNGLGNHIWDVPAYKFYRLMKIGDIAGPIFYNISTLFTKVSLSLFYLRLSPYKSFRIAVYIVMVISIIYNLLQGFGFAWVCQPIAKYWDFSIMTGKCVNLNAVFLSMGCINAATDLALLFLPLFIIWKLQLSLARKISVALLLMTGSFVCVVSLIRVRIIVAQMDSIPTDGTWAMVANFIWMLTEMWLGIVCACLPPVYSFFRHHFPAIHGRGAKPPAFPAVQDPNSDRAGQNIPDSFPDSGYHSGLVSDFSLGTIDNPQTGNHVTVTAHDTQSIRPAASDKSLVTSVTRCSDQA